MSGLVDTHVVPVDTPTGPARCHLDAAAEPRATLVLGHGAGGGVGAADLVLLATRLPPLGITVVRFEQPWRVAGRKVAVAPPQLDVGWRSALGQLFGAGGVQGPLLLGGRSAGARVACRTADDLGAAGVVCLAFPLHLPGRSERSRLPELLTPSVPRLVLQGDRDTFGGYAELVAALDGSAPAAAGVRVVELPGADHGFRTPRAAPFTPADLRATLVREVAAFVLATAS